MNIKTTVSLLIAFVTFQFLVGQVIVNESDSTAQIIPTFKKGQKLKYQVTQINHTPEAKDTSTYHMNFKFDKIEGDITNFVLYYASTKESDLSMEILNGVKSDIRLDIAKGKFIVTNEVNVKENILKNIKKVRQKYSNKPEILQKITSIEERINDKEFSFNSLYSSNITSILGNYKRKFSYNYSHVDTVAVVDPMRNPTREVQKIGIFKEGDDYKFDYSAKMLNEGVIKSMKERTLKQIRKKYKDSLNLKEEELDAIEVVIEDSDIDVDIKKEINITYNGENGIVNLFTKVDQKYISELKLLTKKTYKLLE